MSELPAETRPARLRVEASPRPPGARKPETELGAVSTTAVPHPDSRSGPSPHLQGRVMDEQRTVFVGIDVSKDRLDIHLRPSGEAFCVPREGKGKDDLVIRPWPALGCRSVSLTRARSVVAGIGAGMFKTAAPSYCGGPGVPQRAVESSRSVRRRRCA